MSSSSSSSITPFDHPHHPQSGTLTAGVNRRRPLQGSVPHPESQERPILSPMEDAGRGPTPDIALLRGFFGSHTVGKAHSADVLSGTRHLGLPHYGAVSPHGDDD